MFRTLGVATLAGVALMFASSFTIASTDATFDDPILSTSDGLHAVFEDDIRVAIEPMISAPDADELLAAVQREPAILATRGYALRGSFRVLPDEPLIPEGRPGLLPAGLWGGQLF